MGTPSKSCCCCCCCYCTAMCSKVCHFAIFACFLFAFIRSDAHTTMSCGTTIARHAQPLTLTGGALKQKTGQGKGSDERLLGHRALEHGRSKYCVASITTTTRIITTTSPSSPPPSSSLSLPLSSSLLLLLTHTHTHTHTHTTHSHTSSHMYRPHSWISIRTIVVRSCKRALIHGYALTHTLT